jgi:hypothetical protein
MLSLFTFVYNELYSTSVIVGMLRINTLLDEHFAGDTGLKPWIIGHPRYGKTNFSMPPF